MEATVDEWTMEYVDTEGKPHSFKGNRSLREVLVGVVNFMLKLKEKKNERS